MNTRTLNIIVAIIIVAIVAIIVSCLMKIEPHGKGTSTAKVFSQTTSTLTRQ